MNQNFSIFLTETATAHFKKIAQDNKAIELKLKPSGCSGFSNEMKIVSLDSVIGENKYIFQGINFSIPNNSLSGFNNCVIDYKKEGMNYKVVFDNPNAKNHCGCGESFSINSIKE